MRLHLFYLIQFLFCVNLFYAQKQGNIWYFGDKAGLNFNSGSPVVLTNGQTPLTPQTPHNEGTASIADSSGALLFYTNGEDIWNKNQQVMPNGSGLMGHRSSTQSALIVPKPGSKRYFYVFTTPGFQYNVANGFRYSVVDMCLDSTRGDVVANQKNIRLLDTVAEKLTGVLHSNGVDYWIITHKYYSDRFYAFLLTSAGITNTVMTAIGSSHPTGQQVVGGAIGQMKASPDGKKIAVVNGNSSNSIAEYFDFNAATGVVSNSVDIQPNPIYNYYGISFSPDNTKLYISSWLNNNGIYQYDLTAGGGSPAAVKASRTTISTYMPTYGLQLATNGKIYTTRGALQRTYLSVINNPNLAGIACNFVDSAVSLAGRGAFYGLPNFIDSYKYLQTGNELACPSATVPIDDTGIGEFAKNSGGIFPNPFNNFLTINSAAAAGGEFVLFDQYGALVYKHRLDQNAVFEINTAFLKKGVYYFLLKDARNLVVKKGKVMKE